MHAFVHQGMASKVIFGSGVADQAPAAAAELGCRRVMVLATRSQEAGAERLMQQLGPAGAAVFARAAMHTPVEVTEAAMAIVASANVDGLIALGGGSAIGLSKAIALRTDLPQVVIPTTYAGSEMTPILGQTQAGAKTTQRSPKVLPETVIYDVDLTLSLPSSVSVTSGFNAMAHAAEALYSRQGNRLLSAIAEECIRVMARALPRIVVTPDDPEPRADALEAAWLGGRCLAEGGSALHHRLCHILGGAFDLPHAETHTVLLPHVLAFNAAAAPGAIRRLGLALGVEHPPQKLFDLAQSLGAPASLGAIGMPRDGVDGAIDTLLTDPVWNPRPLEAKPLKAMLRRAFDGARPR